MTAVSKLSEHINIEEMYNSLEINDIVKFVEYKTQYKGYSKKLDKKVRKNKVKRTFFNQSTIHIYDGSKVVNVKIFNNGNIQMTGLKYEGQGKEILNILKDILIEKNKSIRFFENENIDVLDYRIVLINSDFDIKYSVDREKLHREIINLGLYSTYEPCMYPGVNIKYYFNKLYGKCGICKCDCKCDGKGSGLENGSCKRVTIAVFNSGEIIITGGNNREQIAESYYFITNVLKDKEKFTFQCDG